MKKLCISASSGFLFLMFLMAGTPAMAVTISLGSDNPVTGGSWERSWVLGGDDFDEIHAFIVSGNTKFGHSHGDPGPGLDQFSEQEWDGSRINERYAHGRGTDSTNLKFWTTVSSDIDEAYGMDIYYSRQGEVKGGFHVEHLGFDRWDSNSWLADLDWNKEKDRYDCEYRPNPVPEPATLLLLGAGMIGAAALRRKIET